MDAKLVETTAQPKDGKNESDVAADHGAKNTDKKHKNKEATSDDKKDPVLIDQHASGTVLAEVQNGKTHNIRPKDLFIKASVLFAQGTGKHNNKAVHPHLFFTCSITSGRKRTASLSKAAIASSKEKSQQLVLESKWLSYANKQAYLSASETTHTLYKDNTTEKEPFHVFMPEVFKTELAELPNATELEKPEEQDGCIAEVHIHVWHIPPANHKSDIKILRKQFLADQDDEVQAAMTKILQQQKEATEGILNFSGKALGTIAKAASSATVGIPLSFDFLNELPRQASQAVRSAKLAFGEHAKHLYTFKANLWYKKVQDTMQFEWTIQDVPQEKFSAPFITYKRPITQAEDTTKIAIDSITFGLEVLNQ